MRSSVINFTLHKNANFFDCYLAVALERLTISCILLTIIRTYEAVTGIISKNATFRTGSFKVPVDRALTIYLTRITVTGTISAK
jgi:hypothetical protein